MKDWLVKNKENSKEYGNSRWKEQPLPPMLRWNTQGRRHPRAELQVSLRGHFLGLLGGRKVTVASSRWDFLETCPLGCLGRSHTRYAAAEGMLGRLLPHTGARAVGKLPVLQEPAHMGSRNGNPFLLQSLSTAL